jgi:hypothetical protein
MLQRRREADRSALANCEPPAADSLAGKHPDLWEFVTRTTWDDGATRQPGSFTVFLDEGKLKGCLNDKDAGLVCFVTAAGLLELLRKLNGAVNDGASDWRQTRGEGRARNRK